MGTEPVVTKRRGQPPANAFGMSLPTMEELLSERTVAAYVEKTIDGVLAHIGIPVEEAMAARREILLWARHANSLTEYEAQGHQILERAGVVCALPAKLSGRAALIHSQISPFIHGNHICDLGCGDGKVGELLAKAGFKVTLADVYRHGHIDSIGLPFEILGQNDRVPLPDNAYDTTLLLTVLHHADNPVALLKEGARITRPGGRVILIESVFGITPKEGEQSGATEFSSLTPEQQRLTNIYFDHLYNRLIHFSADPASKVNVPFNFNTPAQWATILDHCGAPQTVLQHLGIDQPSVPEYHTLHVGVVSV